MLYDHHNDCSVQNVHSIVIFDTARNCCRGGVSGAFQKSRVVKPAPLSANQISDDRNALQGRV